LRISFPQEEDGPVSQEQQETAAPAAKRGSKSDFAVVPEPDKPAGFLDDVVDRGAVRAIHRAMPIAGKEPDGLPEAIRAAAGRGQMDRGGR
jgi:hypothetical protein